MTATELHEQLEPRLRRQPFVPIRLDGDAGTILFVDNPYRVDLFEGTLTLLHKESGRPPLAIVQANQVHQVVSLDDLPAEPGCLSYCEFQSLAVPLHSAKPFCPYEIELRDGSRFVSETPGQITFGGRHGMYFGKNGDGWKRFPVASVTRVQALSPSSTTAKTTTTGEA